MNKFIPIGIAIVIFVFLFLSIGKDTKIIPSPFINKPFPQLTVVDYDTGNKFDIRSQFKGWTLVNFWASWCVTCRAEHPMLIDIANTKQVKMLGVNYKDTKADSGKFLQQSGRPFETIVFDNEGRVGIELGVYAMPESFLVDSKGIIRYKHLGAITPQVWQEKFLPFIKQ